MQDEYDIVSSELYRAESNFYRAVYVDDSFPEYVAKLKATYSELLLKLHPLCQRSKYKKQAWERYRDAYDAFSEKADSVWNAYSYRDITRAIQPRYRFDGREIKKTYYLPSKNCKKYIEELNDALAFLQTGNPENESDFDAVKKHFAYHHKGFIYLSTTEAESRIGKKIAIGHWNELKRLSTEYERKSNIFISQGERVQISHSVVNNDISTSVSAANLQKYQTLFKHLKRSNRNGELAPHKIILLLAVLALYKNPDQQKTTLIKLTDNLISLFDQYWGWYVKSDIWAKDISMPWKHMPNEPFWHECKDKSKGCYIDPDLRKLLTNTDYRKSLREVLKEQLNN